MVRVILGALLLVLAVAQEASAQPVAIAAEPAPSPGAPPPAYPLPSSTAPVQPSAPAYSAPRQRPDRFMVAMGGLVGGSDDWLYGAYHGELGVTLIPAEIRIRARLFATLYGGTVESDWGGPFHRYGAGLEARLCTADLGTCLFADLDAGYESLVLNDHNSELVRSDKGVVAGPRGGVDWGGALRLRFAIEAYRHFGNHVGSTREGFEQFSTLTLSVALGYQL